MIHACPGTVQVFPALVTLLKVVYRGWTPNCFMQSARIDAPQLEKLPVKAAADWLSQIGQPPQTPGLKPRITILYTKKAPNPSILNFCPYARSCYA